MCLLQASKNTCLLGEGMSHTTLSLALLFEVIKSITMALAR